MKLENIKIVLVGTTHPGNIGAAARAMDNMCFSSLSLVNPECPVGEIAYARASGANAILDNRETCDTLADSIASCDLVIASSARRRSLAWPEITPLELANKLLSTPDESKVALVFGREQSGLNNEEIQQCNYMVCIPTNPQFSSLNLASAVQVLCYQIFSVIGNVEQTPRSLDADDLPVSSEELDRFFQHLQRVLEQSGFINPRQPGLTMQRLRRLYLRNALSRNEVNILRGILSAVEKPK